MRAHLSRRSKGMPPYAPALPPSRNPQQGQTGVSCWCCSTHTSPGKTCTAAAVVAAVAAAPLTAGCLTTATLARCTYHILGSTSGKYKQVHVHIRTHHNFPQDLPQRTVSPRCRAAALMFPGTATSPGSRGPCGKAGGGCAAAGDCDCCCFGWDLPLPLIATAQQIR